MFLNADMDMALKTLIELLPNKDDRIEAFEIANSIATADLIVDELEENMLDRIKDVLGPWEK